MNHRKTVDPDMKTAKQNGSVSTEIDRGPTVEDDPAATQAKDCLGGSHGVALRTTARLRAWVRRIGIGVTIMLLITAGCLVAAMLVLPPDRSTPSDNGISVIF